MVTPAPPVDDVDLVEDLVQGHEDGRRRLEGRPRTTRLLDREQAATAAELAERIGVGRAAARVGVHRRTLRDAWNAYGLEVTPPGGGRRRRRAA